ncbi:MAG: ISNCY-like element ISFac3 family transposase [Candidatus Hadarchaeum sp.]|uniref:ISNCY-like element ISFac3 family transposase n=1 Tax=Candidatus Hadarchaeum sp. TaxID=2883567 RepID=UPI003D0F671D
MLKTRHVRAVTEMLDDIVKEYKLEVPKRERDWRTYEQRLMVRIKGAIEELEPLVEEATGSITVVKAQRRGRKPELTIKQKTILLLLKRLFDRSNREMSTQLMAFSMLTGIDVSYKTVERLYSDEEVLLALQNLHVLILRKKRVVDPDCSGDGTGYSLTVRKHYATEAQKLKNRVKSAKKSSKKKEKMGFIYSFALMDLDTRMYIGYGTSFKSEKDAFLKAIEMAKAVGIDSVRLDQYFSDQSCVKLFKEKFGEVTVYLIPKRNATVRGPWEWKQMLKRFVEDPKGYLREYYRRNQSESGISEDKRRFGWRIAQRREDRVDTAAFCAALWHNLFWLK